MAVPAALPILTANTAGIGVFLATMGAALITRLCSRGHWKVKPIGARNFLTGSRPQRNTMMARMM